MIHRVPLFLDFRLPANSPGAFLAARRPGGLHSLPHGLPGEHPYYRVHHHISYPSHLVTELSPLSKERRTALGPAFRLPLVRALAGLLRALDASTIGLVLDVYLLAP